MSLPETTDPGAPEPTPPSTDRVAAEAQSPEDPASEATVTITAPKLCGVCNTQEAKYKCSRCYLPYCSLACSTTHKATHPANEPAPVAAPPTIPSPPPETNARAGTRAAAGSKGPFASLDSSPALHELFNRYPRLQTHLQEIHSATLPPVDDDHQQQQVGGFPNKNNKHHQRRGGKSQPWNSDRGLQNGLRALNRARVAYGKDGEGVREFSKLVLQIVARDAERGGCDASEVVQREMEEENARIISMLLNHEI